MYGNILKLTLKKIKNIRIFYIKSVLGNKKQSKKICKYSAAGGYLFYLKYARLSGCEWNCDTTFCAAAYENPECLKYAIKNNCQLDPESILESIQNDDTKCLKIIHNYELSRKDIQNNGTFNNETYWGEDLPAVAASFNSVNCLKYLRENNCPWDTETMIEASRWGHLECLMYAHENGCPRSDYIIIIHAQRGHLNCLKYAHKQGYPWHEKTISEAAKNNNWECLRYAIEHGCTLSPEEYEILSDYNKNFILAIYPEIKQDL